MTDPTWYFGDGSNATADEYGSATHTYSDAGEDFAVYVADASWGICEVQAIDDPEHDPQRITFVQPADTARNKGPVTLVAGASSGLPVSHSSATTSVCTVSGDTVSLLTTGTCTIHADQAGDDIYAAAPQVTRSFEVTPAYIYTAHYSWDAPEDDGGCAIDKYRAVDTTTGAVVYEGEDSTFNHANIDLADRNAVKVAAHNCRGWSAWSPPSPPARWTG